MLTAKSVLVIRLSSLGDVTLTTPVFTALRAAFPEARLHLLTKKSFAPLMKGHPDVDETLIYEDRGLWGTLAEIRRRRYDALVDLHDTPRSRLWSLFSGAPRRTRYVKDAWARRLWVWKNRWRPTAPPASLSRTVVDRYLDAVAGWGVSPADRSPRLFLSPGEILSPPWGDALKEGPWIAAAPGARHHTKQWPAERFAQAVELLADRFEKERGQRPGVVLVGAPSDVPAALAVLKTLRGPAVSAVGRTSVRDMMGLLKKAQVLLTNDSGAGHVAEALGTPTVTIFGPTVKAFGFFPRGANTRVVENEGLSCRPCSLHGSDRCPRGHFDCMNTISVERVVNAAWELLS